MAAATIPAGQQPVVPHGVGAKLRWGVADALVIARRSLLRVPRSPELLLGFTIQPVMFVLLFRYVFGGAIETPGVSYVDFLLPGILVQSIAFGSTVTGVGIVEDLQKGLTDRFRSLPMARSAVLAGRTIADIVTNWFQVTVMLVVGYAVGFRFSTSVPDVVAGLALLTLVGFAFSWLSAVVAMGVSSVEAAQQASFTWLFPLTFVSSAFVPPETMPEPLKTFATDINPFTLWVDSLRHLFVGTPVDDQIWLGLIWVLAILVVFAPLAVWRYDRVATR
ncbi:MAG: type transport system permease protein [Solirubrobacteraceae bacterium]|jgi:ABC-2 type transport system permease protein/oleandomycin transport system permease protein|nr:type transport system permease protein [Solirubrobacteraceae bacterium]